MLDIFTCGRSFSVASFGRLGSGVYLFGGLCFDWQGLSSTGQVEFGICFISAKGTPSWPHAELFEER